MSFLLALIVILAILIVVCVLMQPSKADGGLGGLASGMASDVLGAGSNELLAKVTWWMFGGFVILCLVYGKMIASDAESKFAEQNTKSAIEMEAPAATESKAETTPATTEEAAEVTAPVKAEAEKAVEAEKVEAPAATEAPAEPATK